MWLLSDSFFKKIHKFQKFGRLVRNSLKYFFAVQVHDRFRERQVQFVDSAHLLFTYTPRYGLTNPDPTDRLTLVKQCTMV